MTFAKDLIAFGERPVVSPLQAAIQGGMGTAEALQQLKTKGAQEQRAQQEFESQQQSRGLQQQQLAHQLVASRLSNEEHVHNYLQSRLADLATMPKNQRAAAYTQVRDEAIRAGAPEEDLPQDYNPQVESAIQLASQHSPEAADERKFQQQVHLTELQNRGKLQVAQVKPAAELQTALAVQNLKNQGQMEIAKIRNIADSPTEKAQAERLNKNMAAINETATEASEHTIPLYNRLQEALKQVPNGTGPLAGKLVWTTPEGQYFRSLLNQAQGDFVKQFHFGRMTQLEFNLLRQAVGGENINESALRKLFNNKLGEANKAIDKFHFFHSKLQGGAKDPDQITEDWMKASKKRAPTTQPQQYSQEDLEFTAQKHGLSLDEVKSRLGIK